MIGSAAGSSSRLSIDTGGGSGTKLRQDSAVGPTGSTIPRGKKQAQAGGGLRWSPVRQPPYLAWNRSVSSSSHGPASGFLDSRLGQIVERLVEPADDVLARQLPVRNGTMSCFRVGASGESSFASGRSVSSLTPRRPPRHSVALASSSLRHRFASFIARLARRSHSHCKVGRCRR